MEQSLRIQTGIQRSDVVHFQFNNKTVQGFAGETVAVALHANGIHTLRQAPVDGGDRGIFCAMGICQECIVIADGRRQEACRTLIHNNLIVSSVSYPGPS